MFTQAVNSNDSRAFRCTAKLFNADGEVYRCSRDGGHRKKHLCVDDGVFVGFDDWAAGLEDDEAQS